MADEFDYDKQLELAKARRRRLNLIKETNAAIDAAISPNEMPDLFMEEDIAPYKEKVSVLSAPAISSNKPVPPSKDKSLISSTVDDILKGMSTPIHPYKPYPQYDEKIEAENRKFSDDMEKDFPATASAIQKGFDIVESARQGRSYNYLDDVPEKQKEFLIDPKTDRQLAARDKVFKDVARSEGKEGVDKLERAINSESVLGIAKNVASDVGAIGKALYEIPVQVGGGIIETAQALSGNKKKDPYAIIKKPLDILGTMGAGALVGPMQLVTEPIDYGTTEPLMAALDALALKSTGKAIANSPAKVAQIAKNPKSIMDVDTKAGDARVEKQAALEQSIIDGAYKLAQEFDEANDALHISDVDGRLKLKLDFDQKELDLFRPLYDQIKKSSLEQKTMTPLEREKYLNTRLIDGIDFFVRDFEKPHDKLNTTLTKTSAYDLSNAPFAAIPYIQGLIDPFVGAPAVKSALDKSKKLDKDSLDKSFAERAMIESEKYDDPITTGTLKKQALDLTQDKKTIKGKLDQAKLASEASVGENITKYKNIDDAIAAMKEELSNNNANKNTINLFDKPQYKSYVREMRSLIEETYPEMFNKQGKFILKDNIEKLDSKTQALYYLYNGMIPAGGYTAEVAGRTFSPKMGMSYVWLNRRKPKEAGKFAPAKKEYIPTYSKAATTAEEVIKGTQEAIRMIERDQLINDIYKELDDNGTLRDFRNNYFEFDEAGNLLTKDYLESYKSNVTQVPEDAGRYGKLAGKWIPKTELAAIDHVLRTGDKLSSAFESLSGSFKMLKTSANPVFLLNQMFTNFILLPLYSASSGLMQRGMFGNRRIKKKVYDDLNALASEVGLIEQNKDFADAANKVSGLKGIEEGLKSIYNEARTQRGLLNPVLTAGVETVNKMIDGIAGAAKSLSWNRATRWIDEVSKKSMFAHEMQKRLADKGYDINKSEHLYDSLGLVNDLENLSPLEKRKQAIRRKDLLDAMKESEEVVRQFHFDYNQTPSLIARADISGVMPFIRYTWNTLFKTLPEIARNYSSNRAVKASKDVQTIREREDNKDTYTTPLYMQDREIPLGKDFLGMNKPRLSMRAYTFAPSMEDLIGGKETFLDPTTVGEIVSQEYDPLSADSILGSMTRDRISGLIPELVEMSSGRDKSGRQLDMSDKMLRTILPSTYYNAYKWASGQDRVLEADGITPKPEVAKLLKVFGISIRDADIGKDIAGEFNRYKTRLNYEIGNKKREAEARYGINSPEYIETVKKLEAEQKAKSYLADKLLTKMQAEYLRSSK